LNFILYFVAFWIVHLDEGREDTTSRLSSVLVSLMLLNIAIAFFSLSTKTWLKMMAFAFWLLCAACFIFVIVA